MLFEINKKKKNREKRIININKIKAMASAFLSCEMENGYLCTVAQVNDKHEEISAGR